MDMVHVRETVKPARARGLIQFKLLAGLCAVAM